MARFATPIRAFNGGELSPRMEGRSDLAAYSAGARTMENWIPLVQGPAIRRSGTRFVAEVKDSDDATFTIPFNVSTEAAYTIEAGPTYFRFYTQGARLESPPGTPVEVVTPYLADEIEDVRWAQSADTLYLVHPNHAPQTLVRTTTTSFTLSELEIVDGPYLDENTTATTLNPSGTSGSITITASSTTGINDDTGFQASDVGRHVRLQIGGNNSYAVITGVTSTTLVDADVKRQLGGASAVTEWRLGVYYGDNYPRTVSLHEQRLWFAGAPEAIQRVDGSFTGDFTRFGPTGSAADTTPYTSGSVFADNAITYTVGSNELNAVFWLLANKTLNLGTSGSIFNMRASSNNEALTPSNVNVTKDDTSGSNIVQPVIMGNVLFYLGRASRRLFGNSYSLEADAIQSADVTEFADHILCSGARRLAVTQNPHSLVWTVCNQGNLTCLTFRQTQRTAAWSRHPIGGSWPGRTSAVVECGSSSLEPDHDQLWLIVKRKINGVTKRYVEYMESSFRFLDPAQEVEDAFFVDAGITLDGADTDDPHTISGATQANPVVLTINGHPYLDGDEIRVTSIEGMTELNQRTFTVANAGANTLELSGVDGTSYSEYEDGGESRKKTTIISNLLHLEGETVQVLGDGAVLPDVVVSSGQITLTSSVSRAQIGLASPALYVSMPIEVPDPEQSSQGKAKVYNRANIRFHNTVNGKVGPSADNLTPIPFRSALDDMNKPLPPFSGDKMVTFIGGWDREGLFTFLQDDPLPCTLVMANLFGEGGAR